MKVFTTILIALLISVSAFAQEHRNNEIRLNLGTTIVGLYPEISYERIISNDLGIGASLGFGSGNEFALNFNFTPFVRWYSIDNQPNGRCRCGTGFFIEANTAVFSYRNRYWDWHLERSVESNTFDVGFGFGIGWKRLSRNHWTSEVLLGVGRGVVNDTFYPRVGVSIGRRF